MSTAAFTLVMDNTSDATYRTWVTVIHNQLSAMGWVQTGDTGQINLSTATRSATAGQNYEIWRMNDGNTNVYLKIEYVNTNASTRPGIAITTGLATDGAGVLTGTQVSSRMGYNTGGIASDTNARQCYISGSTSRLQVALNVNATNLANSICFCVERAKNSDGTEVTNGSHMVAMFSGGTGSGITQSQTGANADAINQFIPNSGGVPNVEIAGVCAIVSNSVNGSSLYNNNVNSGLWIPLGGVVQNPGFSLLVFPTADAIPVGTQAIVSVYAGNHTYIGLGNNFSRVCAAGGVVSTGGRLAMRYE
jgi:hypothetical protein